MGAEAGWAEVPYIVFNVPIKVGVEKMCKHKKIKHEYSNHLNTGQVWYLNGPNVSCWLMVRILNGGLKTRQKMSVLWS